MPSTAPISVSVDLPYQYVPRKYQEPFWKAMWPALGGTKNRGVLVWHRRAGKDKTVLNFMIVRAWERVGTYFYFFPTYAQGKKIIWDGIGADGFRFLAHVPPEIISHTNETDMQVTLTNGSILQIVGTDKMDSIVGTNPVGCVFSEYALQHRRAWDLTRPILRENGGWAVFVYTPRGKNHGFELYEMARGNPDWFCQLLTVKDTRREDGTAIVSDLDIAAERAEGMDEDLLNQEYFCSFSGSVQGNFYGKQLQDAEDQGRITRVPWEPKLPVVTWWDLGFDDSTTIWFVQRHHSEVRLIDYEEHSGEGLAFYAKLLQSKPYTYSHHVLPHDVEVRELGTGVSRRETLISLRIRPVVVARKLAVEDGINAVRLLLPRCWFDADACKRGLDALRQYRKEYDEEKGTFKKQPRHDQWSHGADAFRTGAVGDYRGAPNDTPPPQYADGQFNPLTYELDRSRDERDPRDY